MADLAEYERLLAEWKRAEAAAADMAAFERKGGARRLVIAAAPGDNLSPEIIAALNAAMGDEGFDVLVDRALDIARRAASGAEDDFQGAAVADGTVKAMHRSPAYRVP